MEKGIQGSLGNSHERKPIIYYTFGAGPTTVLLLGGVHGDEVEGFDCAERFLALIQSAKYKLPKEITLHLCPRLNPDGCAAVRRTNHHNVDLNRNMPTKNWKESFTQVRYYPGPNPGSEPESQALVKAIDQLKPSLVLSLHSYEKPMVNYNGTISEAVAIKMSEKNQLPPKGDIGYPTPGSLGTYCADERNIPIITLEILRGQALDEVWNQHKDGLIAALEWAAEQA